MKIKALDSFSASEVSAERLDEWRAKGFIPKADAAPLNKAEAAPSNKSGQSRTKV